MRKLSPLESLNFFEQNLPEFLFTSSEIKSLILATRNSLGKEDTQEFHADLLSSGKNFIKHIISKSIEYLSDESNSPQNISIETIDKYIDAFTVFEEMLFGLDENYRDHTLHSLWVYLYGHEFISQIGGYEAIKISGQMSITYYKGKLKFVLETYPQEGNKKHMEAMWGMISILHDLGYPIQNLVKTPHEVFRNILDPFALDFSSIFQIDLGSRITLLHQSVCDLLSTMYRPEGITSEEETTNFEEAAKKKELHSVSRRPVTSKDEGIEMEFRIASVNKTHSAWSSILAFKNIAYLHEGSYHGGGSRDYLRLMTQRDILYSILHHTSEEPNDEAINRFQFVLLLIDDIEETIRYSRGGKLRGIKLRNCEAEWEVNKNKTLIKLDFTKYEEKPGNIKNANNADSKYKEMEHKYKNQISRKIVGENSYVIQVEIIGENFKEDLNLFLSMDKIPDAIPSPSIPKNRVNK